QEERDRPHGQVVPEVPKDSVSKRGRHRWPSQQQGGTLPGQPPPSWLAAMHDNTIRSLDRQPRYEAAFRNFDTKAVQGEPAAGLVQGTRHALFRHRNQSEAAGTERTPALLGLRQQGAASLGIGYPGGQNQAI